MKFILCLVLLVGLCIANPDELCKGIRNYLVADPQNIHQFYHCDSGLAKGPVPCGTDRNTGAQEVFDEVEQTCIGAGGATCPSPDGRFAYPFDHHKFIVCKQNEGMVLTCGTDVFGYPEVWDQTEQTCVSAGDPDANCLQREGLFAYSKDVHKYVVCSNGAGIVKDCPASLVFLNKCKFECGYQSDPCFEHM